MSKPLTKGTELKLLSYGRIILWRRLLCAMSKITKLNNLSSVPIVLFICIFMLLTGGAGAQATDLWYGVYQGENKLGWHHERTVSDSDGLRQSSHTELRLAMGGFVMTTTIDGKLACDADFRPRSFGYRIAGDMLDLTVSGAVYSDTLRVSIVSGDNVTEKEFAVDGVTLPQLADLALRGRELRVGDSFTFRVFEPTAQAEGELRISVDREEQVPVGDTVQRLRVLKLSFAGIETETWLDEQGEPLRITLPMGMEFRRETAALAQAAEAGEPLDLLTTAAITPSRPIANPRALFSAGYRLTGIPPDGLMLSGAGQEYAGGVVRIGRTRVLGERTGIDVSRDRVPPPDAQCDYDHPVVSALALQLRNETVLPASGNPAGFWRYYVRSDLRWMRENITPRLTLSLPRASQVLQMRQGDCNEMAVLLCALLRAQGIPAQVVAGVVYVDGKFWYHAWVEAADHAIDPAFGQESADATHIKLIEGDLLAQARILNLIGRLQIEPLEETH